MRSVKVDSLWWSLRVRVRRTEGATKPSKRAGSVPLYHALYPVLHRILPVPHPVPHPIPWIVMSREKVWGPLPEGMCWKVNNNWCAALLATHGRLSLCFHTVLIWMFTCKWDSNNNSAISSWQRNLVLSHQKSIIYGHGHFFPMFAKWN